MCGIFAYLNYLVPRDRHYVLETLLRGLRRLEYRGYDSAGLSIDDDECCCDSACTKYGLRVAPAAVPLILKKEGKIEKLVTLVYQEVRALDLDLGYCYTSHAGIAHTRWATHGPPSPENSHPLSSGEGNEFLVVHNGIITNYQVLKQTLLRHGFEFESDTDTEVIPKLAKYVFDQFTHGQGNKFAGRDFEDDEEEERVSFRQIVMEVMRQLEGAYALIFKSPHYPNELVACKRGSPMLLGVRDPCEDADGVSVVKSLRAGENGVSQMAEVESGPDEDDSGSFEGNGNHVGRNGFIAGENGQRAEENGSSRRARGCANGTIVKENGRLMENGGMLNGNGSLMIESDGDDDVSTGESENGVEKSCGNGKMKHTDNGQTMRVLSKLDGGPKEFFIASDASALVEHTKKVMVIEDNEVVHLKNGRLALFRFDCDSRNGFARPASVERALSTLEMEFEQIMKGPYEHYMQKEIFEQPESLTTTMRGRVIPGGYGKLKGVVLGGLKDYVLTMRKSRRIIFIGCGTSFHAALASRPLMEELSGLPVTMELASDLIDRQCPIFREDTAVFVSQSGETADTLLALDYAKSRGALCVGITNTVGSAIARNTHCGVHINAGCEIGVASTKAYTSQILVMTMMALALGEDSISNRARREDIIDDLQQLPDKVREVLKLNADMKALAKELMIEQSLLVFGRGYNYATALEGALKVKEVALMHSEGILAGEMKHGPLALVDETMPIIVIATRDSTWSKQQSVIQQLQARSGRLIVMCTKGDAGVMCPNGGARIIEVPQVQDCLQSIINIVPLQVLSYHLTVLRGFNVDQPRNLAKSVTTQ